jgi:hypothetical protein
VRNPGNPNFASGSRLYKRVNNSWAAKGNAVLCHRVTDDEKGGNSIEKLNVLSNILDRIRDERSVAREKL